MEKKVTIGNVCFIQDTTKESILLLQRFRDPMQGRCTGVGGKTEFCEDIRNSCMREIQEESGLQVENMRLKGVLKTVLEGTLSSWVLFIYTADALHDNLQDCDEGVLRWVRKENLHKEPLIGFIQYILPQILRPDSFFEGTIVHNMQGQIISKQDFSSIPAEQFACVR